MNTAGCYLRRRDPTGCVYLVDITVRFDLVAISPASPARWNCEPGDREPGELAHYDFALTGAAPDDPDEPPITAIEAFALCVWFERHHDIATEHAADRLRDMEGTP